MAHSVTGISRAMTKNTSKSNSLSRSRLEFKRIGFKIELCIVCTRRAGGQLGSVAVIRPNNLEFETDDVTHVVSV